MAMRYLESYCGSCRFGSYFGTSEPTLTKELVVQGWTKGRAKRMMDMSRGGRVAARARRGRARRIAAAMRLIMQGGSRDHRRSSPSRSGPSRRSPYGDQRRTSQESSPSTRDIEVVVEQRVEREVTPEYTPSTPLEEYHTEEDPDEEYPMEEDPYEEEARMLYREIESLRDELFRSQGETTIARETASRLQSWNADREARLSALDFQNVCLRGTNGGLKEENRELKGELRIARRSWRTRIGDRTRIGVFWFGSRVRGPLEASVPAGAEPEVPLELSSSTNLRGGDQSSLLPTRHAVSIVWSTELELALSSVDQYLIAVGNNQQECPESCKCFECGMSGHISLWLESDASRSGNTTKEVLKAKGAELRIYVSTTPLHYLNGKINQLEMSFIVEIADESQREIVGIIETPIGKFEYVRGDRKKGEIEIILMLQRNESICSNGLIDRIRETQKEDDKLRAYVIDFGGSWDSHLSLALLELL
ncbi:LOW QUALITY PROTEIN: hypothetical protein OSB04_008013 [Centaurea solstitialis]|uniref:Uncharacterized protein n=1 Tax=Centaurea solstitialis TaxID=347529 RepID=A0AA38U5G3_9ASTR|nr:LOW QUALITY PROTEIN: hypothetical protein OSB04_008013 [Centaurea solstitialis]